MQGGYDYRGIHISWVKDDFDHSDSWTATMGSKELCSYKSGDDLEDQIDEIMKQTVKVEYVSTKSYKWRDYIFGFLIGYGTGMMAMYKLYF